MGKLEEAQILWNAIGYETEPDANSTTTTTKLSYTKDRIIYC
jgi:hypothetical protein